MDKKLPDCLFKTWRHSREEDADGVTVYRPSDYPFPPSRGRDGLEVRSDGTYVSIDPGPDDRGRGTAGSWSIEGDSVRVVTSPASSRVMTVVDCDDKRLKVRWS